MDDGKERIAGRDYSSCWRGINGRLLLGDIMKAQEVKYLVVHCSYSPLWRGDDAEVIHSWHRARDWSGIGYHYVITENGGIENGRPTYWKGAHVRNYNHKSLGVCLIGEGEYTEEQYNTLRGLLKTLVRDFPNAVVVGHRDLDSAKECPLFDVMSWWSGV